MRDMYRPFFQKNNEGKTETYPLNASVIIIMQSNRTIQISYSSRRVRESWTVDTVRVTGAQEEPVLLGRIRV